LASVIALAGLCLFASTASVIRIGEVNRSLDAINTVAVPLGKQFLQLEADSEVFRREIDRRMGRSNWDNSRWSPKPLPVWLVEVLRQDLKRLEDSVKSDQPWADAGSKKRWRAWASSVREGFESLSVSSDRLRLALESHDLGATEAVWAEFAPTLEDWIRRVRWGSSEHERLLRQSFVTAQESVSGLRTALEAVLFVVLGLSLLVIWLGERALRPLAQLTQIARDITQRGLRLENRVELSALPISTGDDEVSTLAREFHRMATALLERSRTVELQTDRLAGQNRLLEEMGELNASILRSIEQVLIVLDRNGCIRLANPAAQRFLVEGGRLDGAPGDAWLGSLLEAWNRLAFVKESQGAEYSADLNSIQTIRAFQCDSRTYSGAWVPLRGAGDSADGRILVLEDITVRLEIESRLKSAEHLAAIGRMSAQVAHEVRNPLHSIGLEAELALEVSQKDQIYRNEASAARSTIQQGLGSILKSVERLDKITGNYLKLSKLSAGKRERVDIGEVLEEVLASYAPVCEAQGVRVDWSCPQSQEGSEDFGNLAYIDRSLIENAVGNLFRNALQAIEGRQGARVEFTLSRRGSGEIVLRLEDNGPGIAPEVEARLFTPFVTSRAQGTGLGLSFAKQVFEEHGGSLRSLDKSTGRWGGAVFEMTLPIAPPRPPQLFDFAEDTLIRDHRSVQQEVAEV
jgi:nitrogen fixation/metabolism regulation signal transduction histidine kinase